ncbi:MAG: hypothetical protein WAK89_02690 [Candidatus Sulfotelmatobacter sp.]
MRIFDSICLGLILQGSLLLASVAAWSQDEPRPVPVPAATGPASDASTNGDASVSVDDSSVRMLTPPPVSGQSYPIALTSQERSNYLRAGLAFTSAYTDNAVGPVDGHPVSDVSYSVWPTVALDETTTRSHLVLTYAPGFTFYQRESSLNQADENASINFQYRLSPHVTFSARDGFQKSSSVFNQPDLGTAGVVSGGTQVPNQSVIAPIADQLSNSGNVGITYQFAANSMVGASGTFTNLHYPDQSEVPGLFDSASQSGLAFYSVRVSRINYFGASYQYQRLASYPAPGTNETQTHALLLFYTVYPTKRFSISVFGGPQYADSGPQFSNAEPPSPPACTSSGVLPGGCPTPAFRNWNPSAGGSLGWQGRMSSLAISYAHLISSGGGLIGAVKMDSASASIHQQLLRMLSASVAGGYAQNDVLTTTTCIGCNGHTVSGTASLQQLFGQHLNVQLGYTRLHQDYAVAALATPDTNREFVSISYQFSRPLGR